MKSEMTSLPKLFQKIKNPGLSYHIPFTPVFTTLQGFLEVVVFPQKFTTPQWTHVQTECQNEPLATKTSLTVFWLQIKGFRFIGVSFGTKHGYESIFNLIQVRRRHKSFLSSSPNHRNGWYEVAVVIYFGNLCSQSFEKS